MTRHASSLALLLLLSSGPAAAFGLLGSKWDADKGPSYFHLEPNGSADIDDGSDLDAVRSAFRRWSCVPGSRLRLLEGEGLGAKEGESFDGRNSVFWDEDGTFGLGVATLGITLGPASGEGSDFVERTWSTIVFNGVHHTWSTSDSLAIADDTVDVESIAVHESGHWIGLGHPCEDAEETLCLGPDASVMHPTYPGGLLRDLRDDDESGARELYPQEDDSTCDGPFRQGEPCSCNDECIEGLLCVQKSDGSGLCSPPCTSESASCPAGFACVLGGEEGAGQCLPREGGAPPGAVCQRDDECAEGLCAVAAAVGRTVCRVSCDDVDDCPAAHECRDGVCLSALAGSGIACDATGGDFCSCGQTRDRASPWLALSLLGVLVCAQIRRKSGGLNQAPSFRLGVAYGRLRSDRPREAAEPAEDRTVPGTRSKELL